MAATMPELVGRAAELSAMAAHLDALSTGHGRLVLISGEPGIGKSRLAAAVADLARRRGFGVVLGRCQETEGAPPYWPWTQIFRELGAARVDPEPPPLLVGGAGGAAGTDRFRLFDAASELLARTASSRPLLVVLDDLHRADEGSLALLRFVVPALARTPILLVGAYRDTEVTAHHPLTHLLGEVAGGDAFELVPLRGLSPTGTAELAARHGVDTDVGEIHERTGGNPFFLTEVLRLGGDTSSLPATVDAAIRARLARLPANTRVLLGLAAVLGRDVDARLLSVLADRSSRDVVGGIAPAVEAGLLTRSPDARNHRFVHILVQRSLYEAWPAGQLADIHDRVVGAIGDDGDAVRLAHHAACATGVPGGVRRAFDLACRAARASAARLADADAADWYARALDLATPDDDHTGHLLLELGRCAGRAGRVPDARAAFERAWALGTEQGVVGQPVAAVLGLGEVVVSAGQVDAGLVRMLERTLNLLGPDADADADRIRVTARLATELYWGHELGRARTLAAAAVADARAGDDRRALAAALAAAQFVLRGPDGLVQRIELGRELVAVAVHDGDEEAELNARRLLIPDLLQTDPVRADAELAALDDLATSSRWPLARWYVLVFRAMRAIMAGLADAPAAVGEAHSLGRRIQAQPATIYAAGQRFALRHQHGATAEIEGELRRLAARYPVLSVFRCQLAVVLAENGRTEEAAALLDELTADGCAALPPDSLWLANVGLLAQVAAALDDAGHAADLHARLLPYRGRIAVQGVPIWNGAVDRPLALTATTLGRWDEAEAGFRSALRLHESWGATPFVALTLREHAAMLRRRGDRPRAARLSAQADALAPGNPVAARPGGLTGRESEVLALLAGGSSNKEIAARLRLSVHTVERHVANAYLKIGARNRAEATSYVLRRN